jgi:hypothetical protein
MSWCIKCFIEKECSEAKLALTPWMTKYVVANRLSFDADMGKFSEILNTQEIRLQKVSKCSHICFGAEHEYPRNLTASLTTGIACSKT